MSVWTFEIKEFEMIKCTKRPGNKSIVLAFNKGENWCLNDLCFEKNGEFKS